MANMPICEHSSTAKRLRFFKGAAFKSVDPQAPKWKFHIESLCANCGKHLKFLPQTPELIEEINENLLIENFLEGRENNQEDNQMSVD